MWSTGDGFDPESRNKAVYRHTVTIDLRPYIPPEKIDAKTGHVDHDTTWKVLAEQRSNIMLTPQARDPSRAARPLYRNGSARSVRDTYQIDESRWIPRNESNEHTWEQYIP